MKYKEKYMISDLIKKLEEIKEKEGDLPCVVSEEHEYWGSVQTYIGDFNLEVNVNAQPDGPKKKSVKSVVFSYN